MGHHACAATKAETIGYKRRPSRVYRWMQWNMAADFAHP